MLAVALIGFSLAAIDYKRNTEKPSPTQNSASADDEEGEIDDDEL